MSDIFAKLYEKKGKQVLVTKETDDEDCPALAFRATTKSGHSMTLKVSFKDGDWDKRDDAFEKVTEKSAWSMVSKAPGMQM